MSAMLMGVKDKAAEVMQSVSAVSIQLGKATVAVMNRLEARHDEDTKVLRKVFAAVSFCGLLVMFISPPPLLPLFTTPKFKKG